MIKLQRFHKLDRITAIRVVGLVIGTVAIKMFITAVAIMATATPADVHLVHSYIPSLKGHILESFQLRATVVENWRMFDKNVKITRVLKSLLKR